MWGEGGKIGTWRKREERESSSSVLHCVLLIVRVYTGGTRSPDSVPSGSAKRYYE